MTIALRRLDLAAAQAIRDGRCPPGLRCAPDYPGESDRIAAAMHLERCAAGADPGEFGVFAVCACGADARPPGEPIVVGGVGFHGTPDEFGRVEIGYAIAASARGKGFATAAVRQLAALASSLGATTLIAETEPGNLASQTVLRRCGFSVTTSGDSVVRLERAVG